jgi:hypothetical protein
MTHLTCTDGHGRSHDAPAEGFLVSPEGMRVLPICRKHADEIIAEYARTPGETWTFEAFDICPTCGGIKPECGCHSIK